MKAKIFIICFLLLSITSCNFLDLEPTDRVGERALLNSTEGIKSILGNLYAELTYDYPGITKDEFMWGDRGLTVPTTSWDASYKKIRKINTLISQLETVDPSIMSAEQVQIIKGECLFLRANEYFQLVRRFFGVSIITKAQEFTSDIESLRVPRSTEEDSWDFILRECDEAANLLPESRNNYDSNQLTKWAAYALKCRVALYAASSAKFSPRLPLVGQAVDMGLVGMKPELANKYYSQCIEAADKIIDSGKFSLFGAHPNNPEEAKENYRSIFYRPEKATCEVIFKYMFHNTYKKHSFTMNHVSKNVSANASGEYSPTLELIDLYESMTSNGESAPVFTKNNSSVSNDINNYDGFDKNADYKSFKKGELMKLFDGKDPRMFATIVLPEENWIGHENIIQGGIVNPDGSTIWLSHGQVDWHGKTYYSFGAKNPNDYSGFGDRTSKGGHSLTGFWGKKYINTDIDPNIYNEGEGTPVVVFRLAEIFLNYAEAVAESGLGDRNKAISYINDLRKRAFLPDAGKVTESTFSIDRVMRERNVELALEPVLVHDYFRRKEGSKVFNGNFRRSALVPMLDLRDKDGSGEPSWIFVRSKQLDQSGLIFYPSFYYEQISGLEANGLIPNPQF